MSAATRNTLLVVAFVSLGALVWLGLGHDLDEAPDSVRVTKEGWRSAVLDTLHDAGEVESWVSLVRQ